MWNSAELIKDTKKWHQSNTCLILWLCNTNNLCHQSVHYNTDHVMIAMCVWCIICGIREFNCTYGILTNAKIISTSYTYKCIHTSISNSEWHSSQARASHWKTSDLSSWWWSPRCLVGCCRWIAAPGTWSRCWRRSSGRTLVSVTSPVPSKASSEHKAFVCSLSSWLPSAYLFKVAWLIIMLIIPS